MFAFNFQNSFWLWYISTHTHTHNHKSTTPHCQASHQRSFHHIQHHQPASQPTGIRSNQSKWNVSAWSQSQGVFVYTVYAGCGRRRQYMLGVSGVARWGWWQWRMRMGCASVGFSNEINSPKFIYRTTGWWEISFFIKKLKIFERYQVITKDTVSWCGRGVCLNAKTAYPMLIISLLLFLYVC